MTQADKLVMAWRRADPATRKQVLAILRGSEMPQ